MPSFARIKCLVLQLTFKERKSNAHTGEVSFVDEDGVKLRTGDKDGER